MEVSPEVIKLGIDLGNIVAKNSAQAIMDKIRAIKASGDKDKIIGNLEEIINDLISDKNQLIQLVQAYEEKLITQKISDSDIEYITENILPFVESLLESSNDESAEKARESMAMIKSILSKEIINIMQLLGFNFKKAIGEPLTNLVSAAIASKTPIASQSEKLQALQLTREIEYIKVVQDEETYNRLLQLYGKG
jgi:hypothetical protein